MKPILRRDFLKTWFAGALALPAAWQLASWKTSVLQAQALSEDGDATTNSKKDANRPRTTVLEDMARWVWELKYEDLPPEVVTKATRVLLDTLGCALGALDGDPIRIARQVVALQGGNPQATVIGIGSKVTCDQAAFLNGMAIRYLDYNDYAAMGSPHHCSINAAPALAVAEMRGLNGRDLLLGLVAGYEVQLRFRDATEGAATAGWDTGSISEAYSSAAVAAKLLGLDTKKIANAMAIAGAHAMTLQEVRTTSVASGGEMTPAKGTAEPIEIRNGTFAALLAQAGLTYPLTILDGKSGYAKVVSHQLKEELLRKRTGDFQIMKSCIKLWPCVVTAQAPIAAALQIHRQKVAVDEIERITVSLGDFAYNQQQELLGEIKVREHADHSVPYIVSRALLDGDVKVDDFEPRRFKDPRALELIKKVGLRDEPSLAGPSGDLLGASVEVRLRDGKVLTASVPVPPGTLQNPADEKTITTKFLTLSESVLGKAQAVKAAELVLSVEKITDLGTLLNAVSMAGKKAE